MNITLKISYVLTATFLAAVVSTLLSTINYESKSGFLGVGYVIYSLALGALIGLVLSIASLWLLNHKTTFILSIVFLIIDILLLFYLFI